MLNYKKKDKPLDQAVEQVLAKADHSTIPSYIAAGKRFLREDAQKGRDDQDGETQLFD